MNDSDDKTTKNTKAFRAFGQWSRTIVLTLLSINASLPYREKSEKIQTVKPREKYFVYYTVSSFVTIETEYIPNWIKIQCTNISNMCIGMNAQRTKIAITETVNIICTIALSIAVIRKDCSSIWKRFSMFCYEFNSISVFSVIGKMAIQEKICLIDSTAFSGKFIVYIINRKSM